jgi:hypothetical protein
MGSGAADRPPVILDGGCHGGAGLRLRLELALHTPLSDIAEHEQIEHRFLLSESIQRV